MKKKLMALLTAVATILGLGFASSAAYAVDYGGDITVNGNVATASYSAGTFQPNESFTVSFEETYVSNVQQIAMKSWGPFTADATGAANIVITLTAAGVKAAEEGKLFATITGDKGTSFTSQVVDIPATGPGNQTGSSDQATSDDGSIAYTGAAIAPYVVAVVLLAVAAMALFVVRKSNKQR